jgi:hypothetical protein
MENVGIFYGHLEYFTGVGVLYDHLVHFDFIWNTWYGFGIMC